MKNILKIEKPINPVSDKISKRNYVDASSKIVLHDQALDH